ncbi:HNH endonuclease [Photobacterium swingsii]|uniref:HNH endonuclease n=1 Tax=Photobacterium swingsii TaxID=680026 RepID=UPI0035531D4D
MPAITIKEIKAAFQLGLKAYEQDISASQLKNKLVDDYAMNPSSAHGYIEIVQHMLNGRQYTRTINAQATEFYLQHIYERYGIDKLKNAVEAVRKHLDYYLTTKTSKQQAVRKICEQYTLICEQDFEFSDLDKSVQLASLDCSEARLLRLKSAPQKALLIDAQTKRFRRNPDVVAERFFLAQGICEACNKPAPFKRKDGRPYLEVHHKKMLSAGGLDCLENTEALCPNCHRERHFG